jgi:hypothetical protein
MHSDYLKQHVNLDRGATEAGDRSNGASPKSLMSRGNLLMSEKGADNKLISV